MDIGTSRGYPAGALSNFSPHPFELDGVLCNSMEGFLQSLKFSNPEMQKHICSLVGREAKFKGKEKTWWKTQTLYWQGQEIKRNSDEYQVLLWRAYSALAKNIGFKKALLASGDAALKHSLGKSDPTRTVLTEREFCSILTRLRVQLQKEQETNDR